MMTKMFVQLHDEAWVKENCVLIDYDWVPKIYAQYVEDVSTLINGAMYSDLVGKTAEVIRDPLSTDHTATGYEFTVKHGNAKWCIPSWLIKAYWETEE